MIAEDFYNNSIYCSIDIEDIGKYNPPEIFHANFECKRMLVQLMKVFKINKPSVAAFSLLATNF